METNNSIFYDVVKSVLKKKIDIPDKNITRYIVENFESDKLPNIVWVSITLNTDEGLFFNTDYLEARICIQPEPIVFDVPMPKLEDAENEKDYKHQVRCWESWKVSHEYDSRKTINIRYNEKLLIQMMKDAIRYGETNKRLHESIERSKAIKMFKTAIENTKL